MPGSKPGERRGGRQKGTPNKVTAELRGHAQQYTVEALEGLAQIARTSQFGADSSMAALMARIDGRTRGIERVDHV